MKLRFIFFLLLLFNSSYLKSQQPETPFFPLPKDVIPPSPTASELGKYGATVIDKYTGTTQVNIPLYNIEAGSLNIPISLSYNSSGIRVEDIASWVGLGWSLNAGGVISVNVMGLPDLQKPRASQITYEKLINYNFPSDEYVEGVNHKFYDVQRDIFNYNFCGYSGQFVIDDSLKVHSVKNCQGLTFSCDTVSKKITAIDNNGRKFIFDVLEKTIRKNYSASFMVSVDHFFDFHELNSDYDSTITAFFLSKIILENSKGEVNFSYAKEIQKYNTRVNGSLSTTLPSQYPPSCEKDYLGIYWDGNYDVLNYSSVTNKTWRLSNVDFNAGGIHLKFESKHNRLDLSGTKALTKVVMYTRDSLTSWNFDYTYLQSPLEKYENNGIGQSALHNRLALSEVKKTSNSNKSLNPIVYSFRYYGESEDEVDLRMPFRTSCDGYDHWGYYNYPTTQAKSVDPRKLFPLINPTTEIPRSFAISLNGGTRELFQYPEIPTFTWGGDRTPNGNNAKSFSLKSIIYPTGGETIFNYEGNTYSHVGNTTYGEKGGPGIRIKSVADKNGLLEIVTSYSYSGGVILQEPIYTRSLFRNFSTGSSCINEFNTFIPGYTYLSGGYIISTNSMDNIVSFISNQVSYMSVEESKIGNGNTKYYYTTPNEFSEDYTCRYAYKQNSLNNYNIWDMSINRPIYPFTGGFYMPIANIQMLKKKQVYNQQNELIQESSYYYNVLKSESVYNYDVYCDDKLYIIKFFPILAGKCFTDSIVEKEYYGDEVILKVSKYDFDTQNELLISDEIKSNDDIYKTIYRYPSSYTHSSSSSNVLKKMVDKRFINYPTEIVKFKNNKVISSGLLTYKTSDSINFFSSVIYKLSINNICSDFVNSSINSNQDFVYDSRYKIEKTFDEYDNHGNLSQITDKGVTTSYVWGYQGIFPVAKASSVVVEQLAYTGFEGVVPFSGSGYYGEEWTCGYATIYGDKSFTGDNCLENQGSTISTVKILPAGTYRLSMRLMNKPGYSGGAVTVVGQAIQPFWPGTTWSLGERTITLSAPQRVVLSTTDNILVDDLLICPVGAQVDTYTWKPGVGMTSHTDPNGITTFYEYDGLGRLSVIRDHQGNAVKNYDYHYAGQDVTDDFFTCRVEFNSQGGSIVPEITTLKGSSIAAPATPARTGYTFVGWYKEATCTNLWNFSTDVVTANLTLYAKWAIKTYSISATASAGGSITPSGTTTVNHGGAVTITVTPSSGYRVKDVTVNGASVGAVSSYTFSSVTSNQTLYAEFTLANSVTPTALTFDGIATSQAVSISSTTSWTATKSASWITVTPTSGTGNGTITVKPSKNTGAPRSGTITVSFGSSSQTITIEQGSTTIIPEEQI